MSEDAALYRAFRERGGWTPLLFSRVFLIFSGADRVRYLNGQVTANLTKARPPAVVPACVTTAKGKLCADVFVTVRADDIVLDAEAALAEPLRARLEKYIVADDVQISEPQIPLARVHLAGVGLDAVPAEWRGELAVVNRLGVPGVENVGELPQWVLWVHAQGFPALSGEVEEIVRIEHGVPKWGAELDENTFPSEAGLDQTHVDYHKGCYIGQEVISRLRSVGQANRGMRGFVADHPLAAGMGLFTMDDPAKDWGKITSATHSLGLDRAIGLGYLRRGAPESGLLAASADAPDAPVPVQIHSLPFVS